MLILNASNVARAALFAAAAPLSALFALGCGGSSSNGGQAGNPQVTGDAGDTIDAGDIADAGGNDSAAIGDAPFVVPLSSCAPTTYTASISLGGSEAFDMIVDTGSTTVGVAAATCTNCSVKPKYTPGMSAVDKMMTATSQYGSGSWSGEIWEDGLVAGSAPSVPVDLVAIGKQTGFFQPASCTGKSGGYEGILGLGPSAAAVKGTTGYFDQLVAAAKVPDVFAVQLCDGKGTLWLGGFDMAAMMGPPVYTPEIAGIDTFYYAVNLASITIGGQSVPVATAQYSDAVVDTGTSVFILPTAAYDAVTMAVASDANFQAAFGSVGATWFGNPNNCMAVTKTKAELDASLPPITLVFGSSPGVEVKASATESYLVSFGGQWCPGLYAMDPGPQFPVAAILGSPVLRSNVVIFDRANKQIGFAPHAPCN